MSKAQEKTRVYARPWLIRKPTCAGGRSILDRFLRRCKAKWGPDFDPYRYFDLDYTIVMPNMDPRISRSRSSASRMRICAQTGFGATIRARRAAMPLSTPFR